jgi:hypothetical protein
VAVALALGTAAYVVFAPFFVARYPMMTDAPFHGANASILRHWHDPSWHFREQFELQPFRVPYLSFYLLAGLFMSVFSAVTATKIAAALMLALLPAGLAVLAHGMGKSPLLGLAGLGLVWSGLTSWGFLNHLAALGLFAMALGVAFLLAKRPTPRRQVVLAVLLLAVFFTHPFRFPFVVAATVAATALVYPVTRRIRPLAGALVLPVALFLFWLATRPSELAGGLGPLELHGSRLDELATHLAPSLTDPAQTRALDRAIGVVAILAALLFAAALARGRSNLGWRLGAHATVFGCAAVFLLSYLVLPMEIGIWWYVYPREATAAVYVALALIPDLPRAAWLRLAAVAVLCAVALPLGSVVTAEWRRFDAATADLAAVAAKLPRAPRLMYLVFDHGGAAARTPPFIHLPAWIQAERGGWLGFHFAIWGASPVIYRDRREPGAVVPPPVPLRWEWTPHRFRVLEHGRFFDWFLVRDRHRPDAIFAADPDIVPAAHEGTWWLYRRATTTQPP